MSMHSGNGLSISCLVKLSRQEKSSGNSNVLSSLAAVWTMISVLLSLIFSGNESMAFLKKGNT